ncbi:hypothetical protein [Streptomyces sp. NPDC057052]|uniref:hypothetical protein n=1 Tax=Streptomyces sp. NPDC057052 TaxID=3346010 RepID=UPI0036423961
MLDPVRRLQAFLPTVARKLAQLTCGSGGRLEKAAGTRVRGVVDVGRSLKAALAELASQEWSKTEVESTEEQAFVALLPPCACCIEYTLGLNEAAWEAQLHVAADALVSHPAVGPDV